jgi:hypothetical protein
MEMPNYSTFISRQVFGVYAGLTASGYDMARPLPGGSVQQLIKAIRHAAWPAEVTAYFRKARTDVCTVNPYWPGAFLLTLAALYLPESPPYGFRDPNLVSRHIEALDAVSPADKSQGTIHWVLALPTVYTLLWAHTGVGRLWHLYEQSIDLLECEAVAREAVSLVQKRLGAASDELPHMVITPNPLQAPEQTDYATVNGKVYVIEAGPHVTSCAHEMLHHVLSPTLESSRSAISEFKYLLGPIREQMLSLRYAWDNTEESWQRVFAEQFTRAAEVWVIHGDDPESAERAAARHADCGFRYVPAMMRLFRSSWSGIENIDSFVVQCLRACCDWQG